MTIRNAGFSLLYAVLLLLSSTWARAGEITVYTALEEDDVRVYLAEFAKAKPNIKVNLLRLSTGDHCVLPALSLMAFLTWQWWMRTLGRASQPPG